MRIEEVQIKGHCNHHEELNNYLMELKEKGTIRCLDFTINGLTDYYKYSFKIDYVPYVI